MKPGKIELADAVIAVTGGGRGIGLATARLFAQRGARVCIGDLDSATADDAADSIGAQARPFALDVGSRESFEEFAAAAQRTVGPIDVLVNNAGIMPAGRFLEESEETTAAIFSVNVAGVVNGMRTVLPGMIGRRRGHVVNVASMLGKTELPGLASYTASKHAVVGLAAAVRAELAGTGVTVTTVLPSIVKTELSSGINLGLGRLIRVGPEDVAAAVVGSLDGRPKELAVPRWLGLYPVLRPLIPDAVESLVRSALGDDRAITAVDAGGRDAYEQRLAAQRGRRDESPASS
jgi:NADP-dependent 3-hydroxy acid dehydrogenase YdfG